MAQLVQLRGELDDLFKQHEARVLVVFREEKEGQDGLRKVVSQTATNFTLALDANAEQTVAYSVGDKVHDSYIVNPDGTIESVLEGTRYERAQAADFANVLRKL